MWPFKKKRGITIPPGGYAELGIITSWRKDKDEVVIITDGGQFILGEKSKIFLEIKGDNVDPINMQIVPDFKNRKLNFIEIIDPNARPTNNNKFSFEGIDMIEETPISMPLYIDQCLKSLDKDLERLEKLVKRHKIVRNIFTISSIALIPLNIYFIILRGLSSAEYLNVISIIVLICTMYYLWKSQRKMQGEYEKYKYLKEEMRREMFGLVKEK